MKGANIIDSNLNKSYKTKKIFTGFYTEVNPLFVTSLSPFSLAVFTLAPDLSFGILTVARVICSLDCSKKVFKKSIDWKIFA